MTFILILAALTAGAHTNRYENVPAQFAYTAPSHQAPQLRTRASLPPGTPHAAAEEVARRVTEADRLAGLKEWDQAAALINKSLESFPDDADLLSRAGHYYMMKGSYAVSESYWSRLAGLYPGNAWTEACWGGTLVRLGQKERAKAVLEKSLQLNPREIVARFHLATLLLSGGEVEPARATLGSINLLEIGNCATWIRDETGALAKTMGLPALRQLCGMVLAGGEKQESTIADVSQMDEPALRGLMDRVADNLWTGYQAMQAKDWNVAEKSLISARTNGLVAPSVIQGVAYCRVMQGDPDKAYALMEKLAAQYTDSPFVQFKFGMLCMDQGQFETAAAAFSSAHRSAPEDAEMTVSLAAAYASLGRADEAWAVLDGIPPASRSAWVAWFNQDRPYIKTLREDVRYAAWAGASAP